MFRERDPDALDAAVKEIRRIAKEYPEAKWRISVFEKKYPVFFRQMKIDLAGYKDTGIVRYDYDRASYLAPNDKRLLNQYLSDKRTVYILEHGIETIKDERTRKIAVDALLKRARTEDLARKYHMTDRGIRKQKRKAIIQMIELCGWMP